MKAKNKIIGYEEHKDEIEHWIALKGETKYLEFANILEKHSIDITWFNLRDIYRYDKRLLVNVFKYLSFYEEYLRAQVWNASEKSYKSIECLGLSDVMKEIMGFQNDDLRYVINIEKLNKDKDCINRLRNNVSHNKIVLNCKYKDKDIKTLLTIFKDNLPCGYQHGFIKDVNNCAKNLILNERIKIILV